MKNYIIYDKLGKILGGGVCTNASFSSQAQQPDEFVMEGVANDVTQKIIGGRIADKTLEEIEMDNPISPEIPFEKRVAFITNKQWQDVQDRLIVLERKT